jgi:ADP-heptose:LPS heptosyltransferase
MFRDKMLYTTPQIHFVLSHAALGDMITSLPAIAYARQMVAPEQRFSIWVPEHTMPLVSLLMGGLARTRVCPLHEFQVKLPPEGSEWDTEGLAVVNYVVQGQVTRNKVPLVDYGHLTLLDRMPLEDWERDYPRAPLGPRPFDGSYIAISVGATSDNKVIPAHVLKAVIEWCRDHGHWPVILGASRTLTKAAGEDIPLVIRNQYDDLSSEVKSQCLDMRDKTTLLEARDWLGHAAAVVGVDGGLLHLAGTTDVPILYGFTTVRPEDRSICRRGKMNDKVVHVGPRNLKCTGCQGRMQLMFGHDFRLCIYKDNLCVDRLHGDDFISALQMLGVQPRALKEISS